MFIGPAQQFALDWFDRGDVEIKREADRVVVDHRFMDSRRAVHLNAAAPADARWLERIAAARGLSRDTFEQVSKSLG